MPILEQLPIVLTVDQVIQAQGMDPSRVRAKSQRLIDLTEKAMDTGSPYLHPMAVYEIFTVDKLIHQRLVFSNGQGLEGELITKQLGSANQIAVSVCTVGEEISKFANPLFQESPGLAMALEGFAAAATEALGNSVCSYFEELFSEKGMNTSVPLNPGMEGWPVEIAQPQIFDLVKAESIGVRLEPSCLMIPLKSLSMVIGIGSDFDTTIKPCDLCTLKNTCTHRCNQ